MSQVIAHRPTVVTGTSVARAGSGRASRVSLRPVRTGSSEHIVPYLPAALAAVVAAETPAAEYDSGADGASWAQPGLDDPATDAPPRTGDARPSSADTVPTSGHPRPLSADTHPRSGDARPLPGGELDAEIERLCAIDVDALSDTELRDHLSWLRRPLARLIALRAGWSAALETRTIASAPPQSRGAAQRQAQQEIAQAQQLTPSEAKRAVEAGRAARRHADTGRAFRLGELSPEHVRIIDELLGVVEPDERDGFEQRLLELSRDRDATTFGRQARTLLASLSPAAVAAVERRKRGRRRVRATDTPDGGFAFSGLLYGTAAETARVALDAFRRPDVAGEHRTPEQRAADGFEQLCAAALRAGEAATQHGARPQVLVVFEAEQLARHDDPDTPGIARFGRSGQPVTTEDLGPLLDDCQLVRIVRGADRTPIEVSETVRTVPAGLWRALIVRDGGCTWPGCDAPAAWCDVAHGHTPFAQRGRLSPDNAALLCRRHHRRFDNEPWRISVDGDSVSYHRRTTTGSTAHAAPDDQHDARSTQRPARPAGNDSGDGDHDDGGNSDPRPPIRGP